MYKDQDYEDDNANKHVELIKRVEQGAILNKKDEAEL